MGVQHKRFIVALAAQLVILAAYALPTSGRSSSSCGFCRESCGGSLLLACSVNCSGSYNTAECDSTGWCEEDGVEGVPVECYNS